MSYRVTFLDENDKVIGRKTYHGNTGEAAVLRLSLHHMPAAARDFTIERVKGHTVLAVVDLEEAARAARLTPTEADEYTWDHMTAYMADGFNVVREG